MSKIEVLRVRGEQARACPSCGFLHTLPLALAMDDERKSTLLAALLEDAGAQWLAVGKDEHGKLFVADAESDAFHYLPKGTCEYMKVVAAPIPKEGEE